LVCKIRERIQLSSLIFLLRFIRFAHPPFTVSTSSGFPYSSLDDVLSKYASCIAAFLFLYFSQPPNQLILFHISFSQRLNPAPTLLSLPHSNNLENLVGCFRIPETVVSEMSWDIVYRLVKQIPRGRVLSYGALAKALRLSGGARSAGRAMAATPTGKGIPWHRVVGERGKILIREPYASLQKKLLESEGVKITESRVDLNSHLWKLDKKSMAKQTEAKRKPAGRRTPK
jgi:methylated-DNA-protein-cysteine methyltransferase-like protein